MILSTIMELGWCDVRVTADVFEDENERGPAIVVNVIEAESVLLGARVQLSTSERYDAEHRLEALYREETASCASL